MDIERIIGADIIMAFDECCSGDADFHYAKKSLALTEDWLRRCEARTRPIHTTATASSSSCRRAVAHPELRTRAAELVASLGAEGTPSVALPSVSPRRRCTRWSSLPIAHPPRDKPRYLMGAGTPINLLENTPAVSICSTVSALLPATAQWPALHELRHDQYPQREVGAGVQPHRSLRVSSTSSTAWLTCTTLFKRTRSWAADHPISRLLPAFGT